MTYSILDTREMFKQMERSLVGFDRVFDTLAETQRNLQKQVSNFPFYNIRKDSDTKYVIELAVAGFGKQDIEIDLEENKLSIKGNAKEDGAADYLFRGLSNRSFMKTFTLDDQVVVNGASMMNGILKVFLERVVPDNKKKRSINISEEPETVSKFIENNPGPQLLTESERDIIDGKLM